MKIGDDNVRLIDADALKDDMRKTPTRAGTPYFLGHRVYECIDNAPTIEAEPVVRCKDCVFSTLFQNDSSGAMARYCETFTIERMVADNDFCSYGERKDND